MGGHAPLLWVTARLLRRLEVVHEGAQIDVTKARGVLSARAACWRKTPVFFGSVVGVDIVGVNVGPEVL